jgi:hydroxymethylpyrimidine kinase / phosphomethylpyrimidine kinase / thiamine-phosphate diphosphorylase
VKSDMPLNFHFILRRLFFVILSSSSLVATSTSAMAPPIVYTIAGSDSGGGAGIQADLHAIHAMNCHGCSAITCLTAQNSVGVTDVHSPPPSFLKTQLETLISDMPPKAVKIGMLGNAELAKTVGAALAELKEKGMAFWVVLDPVMISTSGHKLIDDEAVQAMIEHIFPYVDILTPNKFEAEALLGRSLKSMADIHTGAEEILSMGCKAVLMKGGHTLLENNESSGESTDLEASLLYAQDYLLSSEQVPATEEQRLCDGYRGVWMRTTRWKSTNTHGTGCTLSSSMAAALALGQQKREDERSPEGATSAIGIVDASCLAKAFVSAGIQQSVQLGKGPGPVVQTTFPSSSDHFPMIVSDPTEEFPPFRKMISYSYEQNDKDTPRLGRILPIVDSVEWVERLASTKAVKDIQLRIKDEKDLNQIKERVVICQEICAKYSVRLWINDYWEAAIHAGCFGVHVGQEDLAKMSKAGGFEQLQSQGIALGVSTHSYAELAAAIGVKPSYISLGPVYATNSKSVQFDPQGLKIVNRWRKLIPPSIPFVTIGGIGSTVAAKENRDAGADCVAVIGAVTKAIDLPKIVDDLNEVMC